MTTSQDQPATTDRGSDFASVDDVRERFAAAGYLTDERLATTVFLQTRLDKPVLLEGPAGVGKTQLAQSLAAVTGRKLLRLQCYEGQDETKALYEWDYGKQLLYTQMLREKIGQIVDDTSTIAEAVERIADQDSVFFSERFLAPRPLLEAIASPEPVVLLIDEVDRADEALEAVLLELLAEYQISIPEIGTVVAEHAPYVVLTSNNTRDLSAALKRRCLHLFLDYPDAQRELDIIASKDTGLAESLATRLVEVVRQLRELDLRKAPSISETIDWARTLAVLGVSELSADVLSSTLNVVVKYERDLARALREVPALSDPNAEVPDSGHGHGHGHGEGHGHGHEEPKRPAPAPVPRTPVEDDDDLGGPSGREKRAAKDQPGRHDEAYYGSTSKPGSSSGSRSVSSGQGARSFQGTRKRPV
ncbi:MoxR family ATPase [Nocardioides sp. CFH 31398]|uniref:AAA family ATPase n=1 Tax=Nocardioides sp. CFH 31398 TaxID=2919579 RepID=UPI001F05B317|nr:MoxR family ATPase [Nocardioides sp. CFH 31398]MCH1865847.1 MoxR family ATPase [Nocardioides sp. CFH 31398]